MPKLSICDCSNLITRIQERRLSVKRHPQWSTSLTATNVLSAPLSFSQHRSVFLSLGCVLRDELSHSIRWICCITPKPLQVINWAPQHFLLQTEMALDNIRKLTYVPIWRDVARLMSQCRINSHIFLLHAGHKVVNTEGCVFVHVICAWSYFEDVHSKASYSPLPVLDQLVRRLYDHRYCN